jgi:hypothetical protein
MSYSQTQLCSCPKVTDQVLHPSRTTEKVVILYILVVISINSILEGKTLNRKVARLPVG